LYIHEGIVLILENILGYSEVCRSLPQVIDFYTFIYILKTGHTFGTITNTMDIKRKLFKHIKNYMYKISKNKLHMNDTYVDICI
jgi:hypothetical protein